jgi:hypothetical protein
MSSVRGGASKRLLLGWTSLRDRVVTSTHDANGGSARKLRNKEEHEYVIA